MKFAFLQASRTPMSPHIRKPSLMNPQALCGKWKLTANTLFSIVMEFADDGDVFQRICECNK